MITIPPPLEGIIFGSNPPPPRLWPSSQNLLHFWHKSCFLSEGDGDADPQHRRPPADYINRNDRRKNRLAKNLDSALNEEHYRMIEPSNSAVHTR